jgi:hypothetical protein
MFPRLVEPRLREALEDTRVVLLAGPRQAGKTTLARAVAARGMVFLSLDDATALAAARADPVGFIRGLDRAVVDEVQRAPGLLLAIKESVDADPRPGRFLLTGSADLMTLPRVADSLAGRMEVVRLLPLAQAELRGREQSPFLATVFEGRLPDAGSTVAGEALVRLVLAGGYPEALARRTAARRENWLLAYADAVVARDVRDVADIEGLRQMPRLLRALAHNAGGLVNHAALGAALGMNHVTAAKYAGIFEGLFVTRTLPAWHGNALKRLVRSPKLHFLDSGLLAALRDATIERIRADRRQFGALLETFVVSELLKLTGASGTGRVELAHYRDKDGAEVDAVLEDRTGRVVGIEVKASATVGAGDFVGLRRLAAANDPERFALGLVLHDTDRVVPFGERLLAAPLSALWW